VAAALEIGLDSFSMQGIAEHLGVTTPALYSHVQGRDEVIDLINAALLRHMTSFASEAQDWRGWLSDFAHEVSHHLTSSAGTLLFDLDGPASSVRVGIGEDGLRLLLDAGLSPLEAGYAMWLVFRVAITARPGRMADLDRLVDNTANVFGAHADASQELSATRAVHAATVAAPAASTLAMDLAIVLDGIETRVGRRP